MNRNVLALMETASFCVSFFLRDTKDIVDSRKQLLKNILVKTENSVILQNGSTISRTYTPAETRRLY